MNQDKPIIDMAGPTNWIMQTGGVKMPGGIAEQIEKMREHVSELYGLLCESIPYPVSINTLRDNRGRQVMQIMVYVKTCTKGDSSDASPVFQRIQTLTENFLVHNDGTLAIYGGEFKIEIGDGQRIQ